VYRLKPGEAFGDTVAVSNLGDQPVRFALYATAATPGEDASYALLREEEKPKDVGSWIRLAAGDYVAQPHSRVDVPFSVTVPANATPGDHVGAIVAQPLVSNGGADDDLRLDVRLRIGARVYLRVPGPAKSEVRVDRLAFDYGQSWAPTSGRAHSEYTVRNTGNLVLGATVRLRIKGPFGITVDSFAPRKLPELIPGAAFTVAETSRGLPLLGRLHAEVDVFADGAHTKASTGAWAIPWLLVLLVIVLVAAWVWLRRPHTVRKRAVTPA
jgi:hypothetical protein